MFFPFMQIQEENGVLLDVNCAFLLCSEKQLKQIVQKSIPQQDQTGWQEAAEIVVVTCKQNNVSRSHIQRFFIYFQIIHYRNAAGEEIQ